MLREDPQPSREPIRRVVCSALRKGDRLICGPRHYDPVMRQQIKASEGAVFWKGAEQGFIDQRGCFMTRVEAYTVAKAADQVHPFDRQERDWLDSSHLY